MCGATLPCETLPPLPEFKSSERREKGHFANEQERKKQ